MVRQNQTFPKLCGPIRGDRSRRDINKIDSSNDDKFQHAYRINKFGY